MLLRLLTLFLCVNLSINSEKTALTLSQLTSTNALLERATIKINTAAIPKTSQIKYSPVDPAPYVHEQWYTLVIQADQKTWNVSVPAVNSISTKNIFIGCHLDILGRFEFQGTNNNPPRQILSNLSYRLSRPFFSFTRRPPFNNQIQSKDKIATSN